MIETNYRNVSQTEAWRTIRKYMGDRLKLQCENLLKKDKDYPSTQYTRGYIRAMLDILKKFDGTA